MSVLLVAAVADLKWSLEYMQKNHAAADGPESSLLAGSKPHLKYDPIRPSRVWNMDCFTHPQERCCWCLRTCGALTYCIRSTYANSGALRLWAFSHMPHKTRKFPEVYPSPMSRKPVKVNASTPKMGPLLTRAVTLLMLEL